VACKLAFVALTAALSVCRTAATQEAGVASTTTIKPHSISPIAVTCVATGQVSLLDRTTLNLIRTVEPERLGPTPGPMLVGEDPVRKVFYVGNFNGGLGRIPMDGTKPESLDLGGVMVGVSVSPDGRLLAVNGAHDLTLRLIDLDSWRILSKTPYGNPTDKPLHSHMTHGLASTHPIWLRDGSGVLTEDNIHEEVVLIGRDGRERARRRLRSGVHTFLTTKGNEVLALAEGTVDGSVPPCVVVLAVPSLKVVREIVISLEPGEPAKLHHGTLSPNEDVVVVGNMGPMHGVEYGTTVAAVRWRTGQVLWHVPTVRNAGHVRFLDKDRVIVLGHEDSNLAVLDVRTGKRGETWKIPGATSLGHSLAEEEGGTVLVIDSSAGRLVRVGAKGVKNQSSSLGEQVSEASLSE
jgi:WD40 repeat protein